MNERRYPILESRKCTVDKNSVFSVFKKSDPLEGTLWFVDSGMIGVSLTNQNRNRQVFTSIIRPGNGFGYELFSKHSTHLEAQALLPSKIIEVTFNLKNPKWQKYVARGIQASSISQTDQLQLIGLGIPQSRLSSALLDLAIEEPDPSVTEKSRLVVTTSNENIGKRCGYVRERVEIEMKKMVEKGWINIEKQRTVVIVEEADLQKLTNKN